MEPVKRGGQSVSPSLHTESGVAGLGISNQFSTQAGQAASASAPSLPGAQSRQGCAGHGRPPASLGQAGLQISRPASMPTSPQMQGSNSTHKRSLSDSVALVVPPGVDMPAAMPRAAAPVQKVTTPSRSPLDALMVRMRLEHPEAGRPIIQSNESDAVGWVRPPDA